MLRRRRPLLRAAAVGGTAYMAGKHVERRRNEQYAQDAYQDQQISDLQDQQAQQQYAAPAPAPEPAAPTADENFEQLQKLGEMHEKGILTDEEFTAAKQKILRSM